MSKILYQNLNLFDGLNNVIKNHIWILIDDISGKIIDIGKNDKPAADKIIDLKDKYIMPGLINAHTHVTWDPNLIDSGTSANKVETVIRTKNNLRELLKSGVTYIRECGSAYGIDKELAQLQKDGKLKYSPGIMPSGRPMTITGGHGDLPNVGYLVNSPNEIRKAVRNNFKNGAKCTKVMATGGVMSPGDRMDQPQFNINELKTAVYETHAKHAVIAAHAEDNPGIYNAIKAGVDSIEHGCYINDKEMDMMLKQDMTLTPTLSAPWCIANYGSQKLPKWELAQSNDSIEDIKKNIKNAYQKGIRMNLGTDSGTPFNSFSQTPKELELMTKEVEFSNFNALSTSNNSAKMMQLNNYGTLEKGKYADFLVLDNNPLEDIKAVQQKDKSVYQKGIKKF